MTSYEYNSQNELTQETWYVDAADANTGQNVEDTFAYTYNSAAQMTSESDNTSSDTYAYDSQGRLVSAAESAVGAPTVVLTYQYAGNAPQPSTLSATIDGTPDFLDTFHYNTAGQLTEVDRTGQSGGDAVQSVAVDLTYNSAGQLATINRYQGGQFVAESVYSYDSLGRLTGLVDSQGSTVLAHYSWTYDSNSPGQSVYATTSDLSSILPTAPLLPCDDPSQIALASLDQAPSASALIASVESVDGTASYSYDPAGQLTTASYAGGRPNESYSYDPNGNRTNPAYVTGPDNELLSDGTYTYQYDADGNQTERTNIATGSITLYTWDNRNRLVEATDETASGQITQTATYQYDAGNRWIGETVTTYSGGSPSSVHTTDFVYDGNQIVLQFDKDGTANVTASDLSHRYLNGPAVDQVLADEQVTNLQTPGNVVWTLTDNQGTVRDLATYNAQTGVTTVANHREFDSYGNLTSQTNAAVDCLFALAGMPFEKASGTYVTPTRRYDAATGRWESPDGDGFAAGDTNLYRYCGNSPTNATDPSGDSWNPLTWPGAIWDWLNSGPITPPRPPRTLPPPPTPAPPAPVVAAGVLRAKAMLKLCKGSKVMAIDQLEKLRVAAAAAENKPLVDELTWAIYALETGSGL